MLKQNNTVLLIAVSSYFIRSYLLFNLSWWNLFPFNLVRAKFIIFGNLFVPTFFIKFKFLREGVVRWVVPPAFVVNDLFLLSFPAYLQVHSFTAENKLYYSSKVIKFNSKIQFKQFLGYLATKVWYIYLKPENFIYIGAIDWYFYYKK